MKVLAQDRKTGFFRLRLENPSDVWRVSRLTVPGDEVGAVTSRRDSEAPEDTPAAQRERRTLFLTVRAENIEFHEYSHHVRITGPIVEGPFDLGRYHTLDVSEGQEVTLRKPFWSAADQALLEEGLRAALDPKILVVCADWSEAAVVRLRGRSLTVVDQFIFSAGSKREGAKDSTRERERQEYRRRIRDALAPEVGSVQGVIVAGPGFLKEELAKEIPEAFPVLKGKVYVLSAPEAGLAGVQELLRSGRAEEVLGDTAAAQESREVEQLISTLAETGRTALGVPQVRGALEAGAVDTLLVLEDRLRDPLVGDALDKAREQKARIVIVRTGGEPGRRLAGLGAVAARLRFPWNPPAASGT